MESRTRAESTTGEPLPLDWERQDEPPKEENSTIPAEESPRTEPIATYPAPESFQDVPAAKPAPQVIDLADLPDQLGPTLRAYRERLNLTRTDVALKMKVSDAYVTALETGNYHYEEFKDLFFLRRHVKRLCDDLQIPDSLSEHLVGLLEQEYRASGRSSENALSGMDFPTLQLDGQSRGFGEVLFRKLPVIFLLLLVVVFAGIILIAVVLPIWNKYVVRPQSRQDLAPLVPPIPIRAERAPIPQ